MSLANALKSIQYKDTVLCLTIGKWDIYQNKSLGKSATDFYPSIERPERVTNILYTEIGYQVTKNFLQ
jgi:hypothetical protein